MRTAVCLLTRIGFAGATNLGGGGFGAIGGWYAEKVIRLLMRPLNTNEDAAKTQVFLAASDRINEEGVSGQYYVPHWSWTNRYVDCGPEELTEPGKNVEEQRKLWEFSKRAIEKVEK